MNVRSRTRGAAAFGLVGSIATLALVAGLGGASSSRSVAEPIATAAAVELAASTPVTTGVDDQRAAYESVTITPEQVDAIRRGLAWLAAQQQADGSWQGKVGYKLNSGYNYDADTGHVGVTSLALMAFLAGGHLPGRGEYGTTVERGLEFVLGASGDDGYITHAGTRMYSHAFATLFLAEVYGMTRREDVKRSLQKAVDFIVDVQNAEGGWRYEPFAPESDMSIVVCQVLALRAARNIGIRVPKSTVDRAADYVISSAITESSGSRRGGYMYDEVGAFHYQKGSMSRSSFPLTAAGVTALHGLGIYSDDAIRQGLDYLRREMGDFNRSFGGRRGGHYFFWYGHYYGVQAMYTAGTNGGINYWRPYFMELRDELLGMQREDGAWTNEVGPGDAFGTAMACLILEIPYRYLPIFQR
ncbi:Prenyltransferase and squalene oxidase repeat protein [Planctomycetes bacterium Pla163]|uniref:Prenyltransferase and squalene oxidase repeat protein n=1 Tax=Rohdeia mirabilis TaxID=2528008 RepID=A0A518CZH4_9BACT|nr:Prenyltransferase and squalene oxidase repeat protein [Planctomycetes bacterium Pla163]